MNLEKHRSFLVLAFVVTFCVYALLVQFARAADDDVNEYSIGESVPGYKQHNHGMFIHADTRSSADEQKGPDCKHCEHDLASEKNNQKNKVSRHPRKNRGYQDRHDDTRSRHTTSSQPEVNVTVTANSSSRATQRKTPRLVNTQSDFRDQIRTLNKQRFNQTMQPTQLDESLSSRQLSILTTEEKLERLSKVRRARKELNGNVEDQTPSKSSINLKNIENTGRRIERGNKKQKQKITTFTKNTVNTLNKRASKVFSDHSVESYSTNVSKTQDSNEGKQPHIKRLTMNVLQGGADDRNKKSLPSSRKLNIKDIQAEGQNNFSNVKLQTPFLKINATGLTSLKTKQIKVQGRRISEDRGNKTRKGFHRESSQDKRIDQTFVSDGTSADFVSAVEWNHNKAEISSRRGDSKENRLVRPSAADRLEQRISPDLNRSYRKLMDHLHGILQELSQSLQRLQSYNKEIFNVTRYDIMMGARDIFEKINEANGYIYDGVISATQFAREVILKYHNHRNAKVSGRLQEAPREFLDSRVAERNFQSQLYRASEEQRIVKAKIKNVHEMKMKCVQGESRLKQVRKLFYTNYDRPMIRDLYDYLNTSIIQLNTGLQMSPRLRELNRLKAYLDYIKNILAAAKNVLVNSADEIHKGRSQVQVNYATYNKWLQEHQFQDTARGLKLTLPSGYSQQTQELIFKAKRHSNDLISQQNTLQSLLTHPIDAAKAFVARNDDKAARLELQFLTSSLQLLMKNMFSSLDALRDYIGSKIKITPPQMCKPQIEGSGQTGDGDSEDLCEEEGSGFENTNGRKVYATDDEDFTFISEPVAIARLPGHSLKELKLDLTAFTSRLLLSSQQIYDSSQSLQQSLTGLQQLRRNMESSVSTSEKSLDLQKELFLNFEDRARNIKEIKNRIQDLSQKVAKMKSLKLDDAIVKAKQAIEKTNKRPKVNGRPHQGKNLSKEKIERIVDRTDNQEKLEDDFSYSNLLKQGEEIMQNHADLKSIQSMTIENCGKIGNIFTYIKKNMSLLRQKVDKARQMLTTLQLSMSKSGSGHISVPVPRTHPETAASLTTSIRVCVKPKSLSGTPLLITGNNSASYSVTLDDGKITVIAYNKKNDDIGTVAIDQMSITDQWYTLEIQRTGETLFVTVVSETGNIQTKSKMISNLELLQPLPLMAYVGGVPQNVGISGASWEGCIGELTVNGRALILFSSNSEDVKPSLCTDHCISDVQKLSAVFSGDGFAHFIWPERERINVIVLKFTTHQKMTSLLSVVNKSHRFYLSVVLANGALKIESSSPSENVVLLSLNSSLNDGLSHLLRIVYRGSRTYPELDGNKEAFSVERAAPQIMTEIHEGVLIGAFVSNSRQFWDNSYRPFIGCLSDIIINNEKLLLSDAAEVYNTFQGNCKASSLGIWQSCWQWTEHSKPLSLGVVENSNRISLLVSRDALGPLIHFTKEDKFDIEVTMTSAGIEVSSDDSEGAMIRPQQDNSHFILVTIVDDGNNALVKAWDQSVNFKYGGLWGFISKDLAKPHTVVLGEARDGENRMFAGSISQFTIEDRFYDLSQYSSSFSLSSCERPLEEIPLKAIIDVEEPFSCV